MSCNIICARAGHARKDEIRASSGLVGGAFSARRLCAASSTAAAWLLVAVHQGTYDLLDPLKRNTLLLLDCKRVIRRLDLD